MKETVKDILYVAGCVVSWIIAFLISIYAVANDKYWILAIMFVVGIVGVLFTAYLHARKIRKQK